MLGFIFGFLLAFLLIRFLRPHSDSTSDRATYFKTFIADLERAMAENAATAAQTVLEKYKRALHTIQAWESPTVSTLTPETAIHHTSSMHEPAAIPKIDPTPPAFDFSNWYADNSINLFLYIGAFLIVASVGTFVGFNWEQLTPFTKAFSLIGLTVAFFVSGFILYQYFAKLKPAGVTFLTIAAILVPFNGVAWYKFVLAPQGISYDYVWLVTSLIALITYTALYVYLKKEYFAYVIGVSTLSATESFVRIGGLNTNYYIFGALITSYILLLFHLAQKKYAPWAKQASFFLSSQIYLPAAMAFGLMKLLSEGNVFTPEATISLVFTTIYYGVSFYYDKHKEFYLAARIALLLATIFFTQTAHFTHVYTIYFVLLANYVVDALAFFYFWKFAPDPEIRQLSLATGLLIPLGTFCVSLFYTDVDKIHPFVISMFIAAKAYAYFWYLRKPLLLYVVNGFLLIAALIYCYGILQLDGIIYGTGSAVVLGLTNYCVMEYQLLKKQLAVSRKVDDLHAVLVVSSLILLVLGFVVVFGDPLWQVLFGVVLIGVIMRLGKLHDLPEVIFITTAIGLFCLYQLTAYYHLDESFYPLVFGGAAAVPYFVSYVVVNERWRNRFVAAGLCYVALANGFYMSRYFFGDVNASRDATALMAAYFGAGIFSLHAFITKRLHFVYLALAAVLLVYYWQMYYLGFREIQVYIIPTALAMLGVGFYWRTHEQIENADIMNVSALAVLFGPLFFQALGNDGPKYALLLGAEGVGLTMLGVSQRYRILTYGSSFAIFLAVASQTYQYIASIPRWLITLIIGVVFLAIAIFLLQKREEQK